MKSTPDEQNEEIDDRSLLVAGLLELVAAGTMLRVVYSRDGERLRVAFEGADQRPGPPRLEAQLRIALESMRSRGMLFNASQLSDDPLEGAPGRCFELRPRRRKLTLAITSSGFDAGASPHDAKNVAMLPDIPSFLPRRWISFVPVLLLQHKALTTVEVEFSARVLNANEVRTLRAIYEDRIERHALLFGPQAPPGAMERVLGLWLQNERGWTIRCRVFANPKCEPADAIVEMLGSEVFGVASEICQSTADGFDGLDLSSAFPPGWPFPTLLPASGDFPRLVAQKVVNRSLPVFPAKGLSLGTIEGRELRLPLEMRDRHMYIVGATGTGKSTLLMQLIQQDLAAGRGVGLLDPHGDLCDAVLDIIPKSRVADTFYLDLADGRHTPGINLLELSGGPNRVLERNLVVNELFSVFDQLYDMNLVGGPMFEMYFRNALLLMLESGIGDLALTEFPLVFTHDKFRKQMVERCPEPMIVDFWRGIAQRAGGESSLANMAPYIVSKLNPLLHSPVVRAVTGQAKTSVDLRKLMDARGVLLIRMPKGLLGDLDTRLLGMFIVGKFFASALGRATLPPPRRHRFHLYVDEFQNFVTPSMARLLPEARKFGLCLTLANQNLAQLHGGSRPGGGLLESVLGNVGNLILFRLGVFDAEQLAPYAKPQLSAQDLQRLPNFHAFARLLDMEGPVDPLVFATFPWGASARKSTKKLVLARRKLWGSPRHKIEAAIRTRRERLLAEAHSED
jgi:hypothetical protein